jgi:hypothetical protein
MNITCFAQKVSDVDEETELVVKENATTRGLVSAFSKYTKNRLNNHLVLQHAL